jgi:hypothetical protein
MERWRAGLGSVVDREGVGFGGWRRRGWLAAGGRGSDSRDGSMAPCSADERQTGDAPTHTRVGQRHRATIDVVQFTYCRLSPRPLFPHGTPWACYEKFQRCVSSHRVLLSRASLGAVPVSRPGTGGSCRFTLPPRHTWRYIHSMTMPLSLSTARPIYHVALPAIAALIGFAVACSCLAASESTGSPIVSTDRP